MNSNPLPDDGLDTQPEKAFDLLAARINDRDFSSDAGTKENPTQRHVLEDILAERKDKRLTDAEAKVLINSLEVAMSLANQQLSVLDLLKIHEKWLISSDEANNIASRFLDPDDFSLHKEELKTMGVVKRDENLETIVLKIPSIPNPHDQPVTRARSGFSTRAKVALAGTIFAVGGAIGYSTLSPSTGNGAEGKNSADPAPISGPAIAGSAAPASPAPKPTGVAPEDKRVTPPFPASAPDTTPVPAPAPTPEPPAAKPAPTPEPTPAPAVVTENPATPQPAETETPPPGSREIPVTLDRSGNFNEKKSIAEWKDAGYAVTIKTGRDGSTFYSLTKILEGKEAAFVVKPGNHVAKKTTILASRVR